MFFRYIVKNRFLITAPQVQVFQPDQITLILRPVDDGGQVGEAGENRRDKAGGAHTSIMECFHSGQPPLNAHCIVHISAKIFVQCV